MIQLELCSGCQRHVRVTETACPFCGHALDFATTPAPALPKNRLGRAATFAFGASIVGVTAVVACGGDDTSPTGSGPATSGSAGAASGSGGSAGAPSGSGGSAGGTGGAAGAEIGAAGTSGGAVQDSGGVVAMYGTPPPDSGGAVPLYGAAPSN
jgi:hypothetical protein